MKTVSLTHLTAVSGANCAIIIGLIYLVLSQFAVHRTMKISISLTALIFYLLLVGPQASVLRAEVMTAVVLLAAGFGRGVEPSLALAFSAASLLLINPWLANDYGFQLSVLATFGILELAPSLTKRFNQRFPTWLSLALAVSISSQLVCMPVLLQLQPGLSTYSIPANILVEPLVAPITVLSILACVVSPLAPWLTTIHCCQCVLAVGATKLNTWLVERNSGIADCFSFCLSHLFLA
jgi:competence protein ComEC